jgi:hypothetical protein
MVGVGCANNNMIIFRMFVLLWRRRELSKERRGGHSTRIGLDSNHFHLNAASLQEKDKGTWEGLRCNETPYYLSMVGWVENVRVDKSRRGGTSLTNLIVLLGEISSV